MGRLNGISILIVDDEPIMREVYRDFLAFEGATILEAEDCASALKVLAQTPVAAVISDFRMPGCDGIMLLNKIHAEVTPIPLFYLASGFSDLDASQKNIRIDGFFPKPVQEELVITTIEQACKRY